MTTVRVGDVLALKRRPVDVDPLEEYIPIGIRSFGRGIFHYPVTLGANLGSLRFFDVLPNALVVSNIKAWEGAIAVSSSADEGCIASNRFLSYVPVEDQIDVRFAAYYFLSERGLPLIQRASPGSADRNRTLAIERFEALQILLPPLEEQVRIADHLDRLAHKTRALSGAVARSSAGIDALPEAIASDMIAELSASVSPLGDLAEISRGKGPKYDPDSPHLILNQACVKWDGLDLNQARFVSPEWSGLRDTDLQVEGGDVLVNSTGEGTLGRACIVPDGAAGLPFDSHVLRVRTDRSRLRPQFVTLYFRSRYGQDAINLAKGATTTKQTELGKTKLAQLTIPVPPLDVQEELATKFDLLTERIRALRKRQRTAGREAGALWSAALNRAFGTNGR